MKKLLLILFTCIIVAISCKKPQVTKPVVFYTISASAGVNGKISSNGENTVGPGFTWTYHMTPDSGYAISTILIDGSPITSTDSTYTFLNITANHTISVTFSKLYTIHISAGPHGAISTPTVQVKSGETAQLYFEPSAHFHVDSIWLDGIYKPAASNPYIIPNVTANHVVKVSFLQDTLSKIIADSLNKLLIGKWTMVSLNSSLVGGTGNFLGWDIQDIHSYCSSTVYSQYYANGVYAPNANLTGTSCSPLTGQQFQISHPNHWKWKYDGATIYMTDPPLDSLTNVTLTKDSLIALYYGGFIKNVPRVAYRYHYARTQ